MSGEATRVQNEAGEVARFFSYIVLLLVSAFLLIEAISIPKSRFEVLGAGAFPTLLYSCMILLLLAAAIRSLRALPAAAFSRFFKGIPAWAIERRLVFAVFACLAVYLAAMPMAGFRVSTFFFLLVLQFILAPKTPKTAILIVASSAVFSFGIEFVFDRVFQVFLPRGW
ncbi:tripartite tricarboxylate transporter TctB family protein [Roseibium alexandrii]|uniref:DUF1468 domain-containing protein n=1 Tax=Roseibium alexandrii (strain DSM 17067 / NCIMB 14079 / DFL-11) TaxID=244592 RepID=A0A5E8GWU4_ROSAD|nr:tripartite tricarboxylate transporter TctB family protein [Roseibium alexandrii]EEE44389.1 hypothetical protein SADFL11_1676 [Roseibium alexandrii DFL-11]